jgi:hypothetical protein
LSHLGHFLRRCQNFSIDAAFSNLQAVISWLPLSITFSSLLNEDKFVFHGNQLVGISSTTQISADQPLVETASNAYNFFTLFLYGTVVRLPHTFSLHLYQPWNQGNRI